MNPAPQRIPVDPDLERAVSELASVAVRWRKLEDDLVRHGGKERYRTYAHRISMLEDARKAIGARAERLNMKPGALLLCIEMNTALRERLRRKPTLAQLDRAITDALEVRRRDLQSRLARKAEADFLATLAAEDVQASEQAIEYLQACAT
jgi:hypothetical protein